MFSPFACAYVYASCLWDSLIDSLCVLVHRFILRARWSFFYSSCLSPCLGLAGPLTSTSVLTSSPSPTFIPLRPLHGFVLLPQSQGPGDEVTLHRRAAGLTEPRPSPPPSSAPRTNRPAASPPPAQTSVPQLTKAAPSRPCKKTLSAGSSYPYKECMFAG